MFCVDVAILTAGQRGSLVATGGEADLCPKFVLTLCSHPVSQLEQQQREKEALKITS
jgi:hypothetical protein